MSEQYIILSDFRLTILTVILLTLFLNFIHRSSFFIFTFVTLTGTFLHELAHALVAMVFNGKISSFTILPSFRELFFKSARQNTTQMGGVVAGFKKDDGILMADNIVWYNALPYGMAPLLLLLLAYYLDQWFFGLGLFGIWYELGYLFLMVIIIEASIPSSVDFKTAFNINSIFVYTLLFVGGAFLYNHLGGI